MTEESNMGFGPSLQLCLLENGKTGGDDVFLTGNISMSNSEPRLWVLLRLRSSLSFSETNGSMGPREGRHAYDDSEGLNVSQRPSI